MSERREPTPEEERREHIDPAVKGGHIGGARGGAKGGRASLESEKVSASQLAVYMKGIDFPADKRTIVEQARKNGAPENVLGFMNCLPERQYNFPTDVQQEFGKMK